MEDAVFEGYVKTRYEPMIAWYETRAQQNQWMYRISRGYAILASVAIPVLLSVGDFRLIIVSVIAASVAAVEGITALLKLHETWVEYRTTAETLKKEIHFYRAGVDDYETVPDAKARFVKRVESLISREHTMWLSTAGQAGKR